MCILNVPNVFESASFSSSAELSSRGNGLEVEADTPGFCCNIIWFNLAPRTLASDIIYLTWLPESGGALLVHRGRLQDRADQGGERGLFANYSCQILMWFINHFFVFTMQFQYFAIFILQVWRSPSVWRNRTEDLSTLMWRTRRTCWRSMAPVVQRRRPWRRQRPWRRWRPVRRWRRGRRWRPGRRPRLRSRSGAQLTSSWSKNWGQRLQSWSHIKTAEFCRSLRFICQDWIYHFMSKK